MATTADYDKGELTKREKLAGKHQKQISARNADAVKNQLKRQLETYDFANKQNRKLADLQLKQNSRKTSSDRFEAQRDLQNATLGLLGSMGSAMNGSSTGNLMRMLENRNDKENNTYWAQLLSNNDQVENNYMDSYNQNQVAKRDAIVSAEKAIRDIEDELAANLNNINPNLYVKPGTGKIGETRFNATELYDDNAAKVKAKNAVMSGYITPVPNKPARRLTMRKNDYFGRLMNQFNGR